MPVGHTTPSLFPVGAENIFIMVSRVYLARQSPRRGEQRVKGVM